MTVFDVELCASSESLCGSTVVVIVVVADVGFLGCSVGWTISVEDGKLAVNVWAPASGILTDACIDVEGCPEVMSLLGDHLTLAAVLNPVVCMADGTVTVLEVCIDCDAESMFVGSESLEPAASEFPTEGLSVVPAEECC